VNEEQHRSQSGRRRFYDEEFKRNAVELLEAGGALGSATGPGVGYLGLFFRQVEAQVSLHGGRTPIAAVNSARPWGSVAAGSRITGRRPSPLP
jgi:hypothetical protein